MRVASMTTFAPAVLMACALALPQSASGQDYLRGSQYGDSPLSSSSSDGATDWSGFYAGGFVGYSNVNFASSKGPGILIANNLRNTVIQNEMNVSGMLNIPSRSTSKESFGGFAGYNTQWGDIVLGIEVDYTHLDVQSTASDQLGRSRQLSNGYIASAYVTGDVKTRLEQLATVRGRIGYTMGNFMPFVTGGFAYGTGKTTNNATVSTQHVDADPTQPPVLPPLSSSAELSGGRSRATLYGGVVGAGLDVAFGSVLVRGEVLYARLGGQGGRTVEHTTARVGAGVKF